MNVDIAIVAWPNHPARWEAFQNTIAAWRRNLSAYSHVFHWMCSSESVIDPKHQWFGEELAALCEELQIRLQFRQGKQGLGENMNAALRMGRSEYILLVQDDYPLLKPLNLDPSIAYMEQHPNVDLIRYGWPNGRTRLIVHPDGWRHIDINGPWPYGDEPHLRRRSFMNQWGWYRENVPHGISEGAMLHHLKAGGATIVAADDIYCGHSTPFISAVIDDLREQGKNR